jgi:hypothetical protein
MKLSMMMPAPGDAELNLDDKVCYDSSIVDQSTLLAWGIEFLNPLQINATRQCGWEHKDMSTEPTILKIKRERIVY